MKDRDEIDDRDFEDVWRAFAEDDARLEAPERVGAAVMAAWHARTALGTPPMPRRRSGHAHAPLAMAALAAGLLLAAGLAVWSVARRAPAHVEWTNVEVLPPPSVLPQPAPVVEEPVVSIPNGVPLPNSRRTPVASAAPIVTFAADPIRDTESLHIVRLRLPRRALETFGVPLVEPEASALVDVDVLVGEDGLPRDIRRIRPVMEN